MRVYILLYILKNIYIFLCFLLVIKFIYYLCEVKNDKKINFLI
jgi:hypothetical protein